MSARHTRRARGRSGQTNRIWWIIGSALAVAAVFLLFSAFSKPAVRVPSSNAPAAVESTAVPGLAAYEAGLKAYASGQTTSAVTQLQAAAAAGYAAAQAKLAEIAAAAAKASGADSVPVDATYTSAIPDASKLLPVNVPGYTASVSERGGDGAIVSLQPTKAGPAGKVTLVVATALDKKTTAAARAYVNGITKAFPKDLATIKVGSQTGRFGTDGTRLASIVFSRGRYAFEVVATTYRGAPLAIKDVVLAVAAAFPAAH